MKTKTRVRSGLWFGAAMTVFFVLQDLLFKAHLTTKDILTAVISALIGGAVAGVLFGWITGRFSTSKMVTRSTRFNPEPGETVVFETPANHFKGIEAVGGKLYLTDKRLVFISHKLNIQNHRLVIPLLAIESVTKFTTLGVANTGLTITANNQIEKFIVDQAEEWMERLSALKQISQS